MYFADRNSRIVHHASIITEVTDNEIYNVAYTDDYEGLSAHLSDNLVFVVRIRDDAINGYWDN